MANFQTHLGGAALGGGLVATSVLVTGMMTLQQSVTGWLLVMLGGLLPDIDSDHSNIVRGLFTVFGGVAAIATVLALENRVGIAVLWLVGAISFIFVRYGLWYVFARFTAHRGIYHSLLAGVFFAVLIAAVCWQLIGLSEKQSWLMAICLFIGFIIHLVLDECYSVDLVSVRLKKSFGTAMKLFDYDNIGNSLMMLALVVGLMYLAPPWQALESLLLNTDILGSLKRNLW